MDEEFAARLLELERKLEELRDQRRELERRVEKLEQDTYGAFRG